MRFLKYFQKLPFTILSRKKLASAVNETTKKFIGIETFMSKFKDELKQFTSKWYASPKGILLYGPPGTGKSAITKSLCEELGVVFATAPMAAGDLKKGIQGDSEKTINEISMRCKLIPWEMLVLLIDEIDSLAPDRNAPSSGTGNEDLIGVLLATMDGSKETKNLKIIASTNLLNKIDAAFLRRMEIQLFLGNPNKSSRALWIASKAKQSRSHKNYDRIYRFVNEDTYSDLRKMMIKSSINFSADAYRKLLDRFYDAILSYPVPPTLKNYSDILIENIRGVAEEMKIYLGIKTVIDVFESEKNFQDFKNYDEIDDFNACSLNPRQTLGNGKIIQLTKKVLVDLASKSNKEVFQLEGMLLKKDDHNELIETSKELMVFQLLDEKCPVAQYEKAWLPLILQFALEYDADIVKVIDNSFLINNNANDDSKAVALVNSIVEETKKYDKGVLIFDLDSIVQISKQFQSLKKEMKTSALLELVAGENTSSFSYSIQRPLALFNILELFQTQNDDTKCWLFAVSSHNKLVIDFKEATEWPDTETVKEFKKNESEKDKLYRCKYCREVYCIKENLSEFKCGRHPHSTLVYEESNTDSQQKKTKIVKKEEADRMIHTLNAFPWEFKYTCCGGQYGSKGEKPSRHEEEQCVGKIIRD